MFLNTAPKRKRAPSVEVIPIDPKWKTHFIDPGVELISSHRNDIATNKHIEKLSNTLRRAAQQVTRNSTSDPYIKCTLKPYGHTMQTLPIYGGEFHVRYSPYDNNQIVWKVNADELRTHKCTLHIEVWDSDISSGDEFIGEIVVFMNEDTGLVQDQPLFAAIPINCEIAGGNNHFSGNLSRAIHHNLCFIQFIVSLNPTSDWLYTHTLTLHHDHRKGPDLCPLDG